MTKMFPNNIRYKNYLFILNLNYTYIFEKHSVV